MRQDSEVTHRDVTPVVRLKVTPKPKTEMGDGGSGVVPFVRLHARPKPKTEIGDGGVEFTPFVRLHAARQG